MVQNSAAHPETPATEWDDPDVTMSLHATLADKSPTLKLELNKPTPGVQHRWSESHNHEMRGVVNNLLTAARAAIGLGGTGGASP